MKDKKQKAITGPARTGKDYVFSLADHLNCNIISDEVRMGIKTHCSKQHDVRPFVIVQSINETDQ